MAPRARDRHGRGLRGGLLTPVVQVGSRRVRVPAHRTRGDRFDDLVRAAFDDLEARWPTELATAELVVQDVPPPGLADPEHGPDGNGLVADESAGGRVPLGLVQPAKPGTPARFVVYRRPVEVRAEDRQDLADLVREVVVDLVAELLGLDPDEVDPPG